MRLALTQLSACNATCTQLVIDKGFGTKQPCLSHNFLLTFMICHIIPSFIYKIRVQNGRVDSISMCHMVNLLMWLNSCFLPFPRARDKLRPALGQSKSECFNVVLTAPLKRTSHVEQPCKTFVTQTQWQIYILGLMWHPVYNALSRFFGPSLL